MTDLISGSCWDGPHLTRCVESLVISHVANGQTATISLGQNHEVIGVDAADRLTVDGSCVLLLNVIHSKRERTSIRQHVEIFAYLSLYCCNLRFHGLYSFTVKHIHHSSSKTAKFSIFSFSLKIFVQNCDVSPWFYHSDIAVWNALLSRASKG